MTYFRFLVIIFCFHFPLLSIGKENTDKKATLADSQLNFFKSAIKEGNRAKWASSIMYLKKINNPDAKKIIEWRWLISNDGIASKEKLKEFYLINKDWPKTNNIKKKIEAKINVSNFQKELLWFQDNPPVSGLGKIKLAEVLLKNDLLEEAKWLLKNTWINYNFNYSEEKYILKNYGKYINKNNHALRLERLIWYKSWSSANRQLRRVNKDILLLSKAKILLSRRKGNVDNAISKVPKNLKGSESLTFERVKWRRRAKLEKKSLELLAQYKGKYTMPRNWWREINYHTRKQISYGNYSKAVLILKNFNKDSNNYSAEASWLTGWLSLTFEKEPKIAYEYFKIMFNNVKTPISKARASFWAGKSAKTIGDIDSANIWLNKASKFPATFYGQLALKELNKNLYMPALEINYSKEDYTKYKSLELVRCLVLLNSIDNYKLAKIFALHLADLAKNKKEIHMLSSLLKELKLMSLSIFVGKKAIYKDMYIPSLNYPLPSKNIMDDIKENSVIPIAETLAITRQESAFNPKAVSRAGARGLMQVMPRTARLTAKKIKYKYSRSNLTKKPAYNVKIGSSYFKEMLNKFEGSYILSLAAYNAGPNRVNRWLRTNGDPRKGQIDSVTWVELIPISETRNYVQRVIEGIYMYRVILSEGNKNTIPANKIKLF